MRRDGLPIRCLSRVGVRLHGWGLAMMIGSLFSCIGGLELGLEWAGVGHTVWQVEKDPFCQRVLAKHWPQVERFDDVSTVGAACLPVADVICGGFPCQDVSAAGKGAGLAGALSGLWREYQRIVSELRPRFVVVENVASGSRRWLPHVRSDLHVLGYRTRAFALSAFDVGAPHLRRRVFVLAADSERVEIRDVEQWRSGGRSSGVSTEWESLALDDGTPGTTSNTNRVRELQPQGSERQQWRWSRNGSGWQAEPPVCGVDDGPARRLDRARRLKALGNAVVPQCAEAIGRILMEVA